jgi:galactokinase
MSDLLLNPLCQKTLSAYRSRFGSDPAILVHAPGRINLIGEHTDYNLGFVFPAAIEQGICFAMDGDSGHQHEWFAVDTDELATLAVHESKSRDAGWVDYCLGACRILSQEYPQFPSIRCVFSSDLPTGAGLSSSSALTCGFLMGLNAILKLNKTREELAWLAHRVEHDFIGLQGGIMDQHACMLCEPDHFLLLDCLTRDYRQIAFPADAGLSLFLVDTRVKHKLTDSDYNTRAAECRIALKLLQDNAGIKNLRDLTQSTLLPYASLLGPLLMKRIQFVFRENARVLSSVEAIRRRDWKELGLLLNESHAGLRDEYEVSCPELDFLVDHVSASPQILGARMMGGGFGGCTINLAVGPVHSGFREQIIARYKAHFGWECAIIEVWPSQSATLSRIHGFSA